MYMMRLLENWRRPVFLSPMQIMYGFESKFISISMIEDPPFTLNFQKWQLLSTISIRSCLKQNVRVHEWVIMLDCFLRQNAGLYTIWVVPSLNTEDTSRAEG